MRETSASGCMMSTAAAFRAGPPDQSMACHLHASDRQCLLYTCECVR